MGDRILVERPVDGETGIAYVHVEGDEGGCELVILGSDYGPGHAGVPLTWEEARALAALLLRARS